MNNDLISREALKSTIIEICGKCSNIITKYENGVPDGNCAIQHILNMIDNAPAVEPEKVLVANVSFDEDKLKDIVQTEVIEKIKSGELVIKDERPQNEYFDMSKLRLMTVEECAGHTIDYAMGWKACIEWIKKGGAENE